MFQPHLINNIVQDVSIARKASTLSTPAKSRFIFHFDLATPPFNNSFHYRSVVGKLNFCEKSTCIEISYATHQVSHFCKDLQRTNGTDINHLTSYLRGTRADELIIDTNSEKYFEVYADADFNRNRYRLMSSNDSNTENS